MFYTIFKFAFSHPTKLAIWIKCQKSTLHVTPKIYTIRTSYMVPFTTTSAWDSTAIAAAAAAAHSHVPAIPHHASHTLETFNTFPMELKQDLCWQWIRHGNKWSIFNWVLVDSNHRRKKRKKTKKKLTWATRQFGFVSFYCRIRIALLGLEGRHSSPGTFDE